MGKHELDGHRRAHERRFARDPKSGHKTPFIDLSQVPEGSGQAERPFIDSDALLNFVRSAKPHRAPKRKP